MEIVLLVIVLILTGIFARRYYLSFSRHGSKREKPAHKQEKIAPRIQQAPRTTEAKVLFSQAMTYLERGELGEAETRLVEVTTIEKDFNDAGHKLGLIYLKKGEFGKAEEIFKQLVLKVEDDAIYHSNLGRALYEQEKFQEALGSYLKSIELDDSRPGRFVSTAEVYRLLGEKEKAQEMYKKALNLDPSNIEYLLTFAHFLIEDERYAKARFYLEKVLKLQPDNKMALEMMKEIKD
ncbi:tetratricopeptide repeat protein [Patescibacteria group bacterium]